MNRSNELHEENGSSRENASGQRTRPRWWSDESLATRVWGGDQAMKDVGRAVDAVLWLLGVAFLLFRLVSWLGYGFPDSFGDPSALGFVKSAVLILGFKGLVRRVLIVVLASPLILVHWLVRWVRRA